MLPISKNDGIEWQKLQEKTMVLFNHLCESLRAKSLEDTLFYRHIAVFSLNEVGGFIENEGCSIDNFHSHQTQIASEHPHNIIASTTHDTKHSEDVRAQILTITEKPKDWLELQERFIASTTNNTEREKIAKYTFSILTQTLFGTIVNHKPIGETPSKKELAIIAKDRLSAYMLKASREAKIETNWYSPNQEYESLLLHYIDKIYKNSAEQGKPLDLIKQYYIDNKDIVISKILCNKFLSLISAGVPDVYQGSEMGIWSLVDPDNRNPVDYNKANELLQKFEQVGKNDKRLANIDELKMYITATMLKLKRETEKPLKYKPITTNCDVLGFSWQDGETPYIIALSKTNTKNCTNAHDIKLYFNGKSYKSLFTLKTYTEIKLCDLFHELPVELLVLCK
jgi:(1->4)-alpha-D-glucan 1-alpha-D-glucosylmutase